MLLCARHILPVTQSPIEDGAILVRDGRIVEIGGAQRMRTHYPDEEIRDFGLAALMPGLVNLHTHLEYTALRGIVHDVPYAEWLLAEHAKANRMTRDNRYDSAVIGGLEMLSGGVTTLAEFSSTGASFEALQDLGIRSVVYRSVGVENKQDVDVAIDGALADVESWSASADPDRMRIGIAPKALHACHPSVFSKVNDAANRLNLPVAMHVAGSYEEYHYIRYGSMPLSVRGLPANEEDIAERPMWLPAGVTPVNYALNWDAFRSDEVLAVHCVHVDDADIAKLKQYDVAIAVCSRCNAQLGMGLAPLQEFLKAGIRVGLGTDSPAATDTADMFAEMRLGMLLHRAVNHDQFLDAKTMLELATIGGARALKMEDEIGSLEVGKRADIIAADLSGSRQTPIVDPVAAVVTGVSPADVLFTMVGGDILYERGGHWNVNVNAKEALRRGMQIRMKLKD